MTTNHVTAELADSKTAVKWQKAITVNCADVEYSCSPLNIHEYSCSPLNIHAHCSSVNNHINA